MYIMLSEAVCDLKCLSALFCFGVFFFFFLNKIACRNIEAESCHTGKLVSEHLLDSSALR